MTALALKCRPDKRKGGISGYSAITESSLSTKTASIVKRIKKVCIELAGLSTRAWPGSKPLLPKRPFILEKSVSATIASEAKTIFFV